MLSVKRLMLSKLIKREFKIPINSQVNASFIVRSVKDATELTFLRLMTLSKNIKAGLKRLKHLGMLKSRDSEVIGMPILPSSRQTGQQT